MAREDELDQEVETGEADPNVQDMGEYDVDLGDEPEEQEAQGEDDGEDGAGTEGGVDQFAELRAELEQAKRAAQEARQMAERGYVAPVRPANRPPIEKDKIETYEQLLEYQKWERDQERLEIRAEAMSEATAAASSQRARGALNRDAMGPGYDFDQIVGSYIAPAVRENPELGKVFRSMRDPAFAEYGVGLIMKAIESQKGDAVKAFRLIRDALDGKRATTEDLVEKIKKGAKGQALKARTSKKAATENTGRPRLSSSMLDENGYLNVDLDEFAKKFGSRSNY